MDEFAKSQKDDELETLEDPSTVVEQATSSSDATTNLPEGDGGLETGGDIAMAPTPGSGGSKPPPKKPQRHLRERLAHTNIYLLIFVLLLLISAIVLGGLYLHSKQPAISDQSLGSQTLSADSLSQLANSGVTVGDPKQVLTIQSNAIFSGKVLVRSDLEIAGKLVVGSDLSLTGITVSGNSTFDDVQVTKDVAVTGNVALQGKLTASSLAVSGNGSYGGTVTATQLVANSLLLNSNLTLTHHIIAGGATPSRSNGTALGSGGTSSVSGSDTAGTISINTGGSPAASGCFITVNFNERYNTTPVVSVTPINAAAAGIAYYVTRSSSSFSVCTGSAAPAGSSFGFDYIVFE